jgi:hypothetical protein
MGFNEQYQTIYQLNTMNVTFLVRGIGVIGFGKFCSTNWFACLPASNKARLPPTHLVTEFNRRIVEFMVTAPFCFSACYSSNNHNVIP